MNEQEVLAAVGSCVAVIEEGDAPVGPWMAGLKIARLQLARMMFFLHMFSYASHCKMRVTNIVVAPHRL